MSKICGVLLVLLVVFASVAQDDQLPPPVNSENLDSFQPVTRINFDELPPDAGTFITGTFAMRDDAAYIAVTNRAGRYILLDQQGAVQGINWHSDSDLIDLAFDEDHVYSLYYNAVDTAVIIRDTLDFSHGIQREFAMNELPFNLWIDDDGIPYTEIVFPEPYIARFDLETETTSTIPYALAEDEDAVVRIGRIAPPLAVTSTEDGLVKLWNIQTGEVTVEAQVDTEDVEGPVVFGQLSSDGRYLVWRDQPSESLFVLDFETGENRRVVDLNGDYAQFFFITPDASLIFAVHLNNEPIVVAWDTTTGERYDLGTYRECNRELDMARFSADGRRLVIGCDTGLDIWQVAE